MSLPHDWKMLDAVYEGVGMWSCRTCGITMTGVDDIPPDPLVYTSGVRAFAARINGESWDAPADPSDCSQWLARQVMRS